MSLSLSVPFQAVVDLEDLDPNGEIAPLANALRRGFDVPFSFWSRESGDLLNVSLQQPGSNDPALGQLARALKGSEPQFIADADAIVVFAIPFTPLASESLVATSAFVTRLVTPGEDVSEMANLLGLQPNQVAGWANRQPLWQTENLLRVATAIQKQVQAESKASKLQREVDKLSDNLASTYEEICLLHGLTQNLRISSDDEQLCSLVLSWLRDCLPAESIAVQLLPVAVEGSVTYRARTKELLMTTGNSPITSERFSQLIAELQLHGNCGPMVINSKVTSEASWNFPEVRELIVVPMAEGGHVFGWLAAINHLKQEEFGTVEASLLNSVGAMIGIHAGNRDLYRQQAEFLANVVKALTSAIDAKDPYTCGHSDRVARVSVRLAKELGESAETIHTLYMAGLLHDIGKIGIDDTVLRKPGRLTPQEFEHIKQHPELGYRILADLRQLSQVLPAVLHHHEQWDGRGYPYSLSQDEIPMIARIVAVADAFDAMSSDRPYRPGMAAEKVDEIFHQGAGKQWDPQVVEAFFRCRDDITRISNNERANLTLDVQQWV